MKRLLQSTPVFFSAIVVLAVLGTLGGAKLAGDGVTAGELQTRLIENCEVTRNPLQAYFEGEIAATEGTDPELFPDIPPEVFRQLLNEKIARLQALVDTFDPHTCATQYE